MPCKARPTVELLRELISYDPVSGKLRWNHRGDHLFRDGVLSARGAAKIWNAQHAGKPALSSISTDGYAKGSVQGRPTSAHIVAFAIHHGRHPNGPVGHLNGLSTDNRVVNLIEGSASRSRATAGVCAQNGRWAAAITVRGRRHHLGTFPDREGAVAARHAGARKFGFSGHRQCAPSMEAR